MNHLTCVEHFEIPNSQNTKHVLYRACITLVAAAIITTFVSLAYYAAAIYTRLFIVAHLEFFPSNQDIAVTMWLFWGTVGFTLQFAWSTSLCVAVKIFIQLGLLVLGMGCFGKKLQNIELF